jgi:hypothetical protein
MLADLEKRPKRGRTFSDFREVQEPNFFPQRQNFSSGLSEKFCKELATLCTIAVRVFKLCVTTEKPSKDRDSPFIKGEWRVIGFMHLKVHKHEIFLNFILT